MILRLAESTALTSIGFIFIKNVVQGIYDQICFDSECVFQQWFRHNKQDKISRESILLVVAKLKHKEDDPMCHVDFLRLGLRTVYY